MPRIVGGVMAIAPRVINPATGLAAYGKFRVDTGDDVALLSPVLAQAVGAVPHGTQTVTGVDGQPVTAPVYVLDLDLGDAGYLAGVTFVGVDVSSLGYAGLLGDNVLDRGVLVRDGPSGWWSFTAAGASVPQPNPTGWAAAGLVLAVLGAAALAWGLTGE